MSVYLFKICISLISNYTNMSIFHPLEVLGVCSDTQFQVGENLIKITFFCHNTLDKIQQYLDHIDMTVTVICKLLT